MQMKLRGYVERFADNINTDAIISGRYKFSITDMAELAKHIMEDVRPDFYNEIKGKEVFIAAGKNFGCGSSREQAPLALKAAGIKAVIANNFARIFYRNSFNIGLPLIVCDTTEIKENDFLEIDIDQGILKINPDRDRTPPRYHPPLAELRGKQVSVGRQRRPVSNGVKKFKEINFSIPPLMKEILRAGGGMEYFKKISNV